MEEFRGPLVLLEDRVCPIRAEAVVGYGGPTATAAASCLGRGRCSGGGGGGSPDWGALEQRLGGVSLYWAPTGGQDIHAVDG